jgi:nitroimidazol reductase NimA-like FMN-containing flavoprotein (pyridoxamine 5'-phosphate oxidase superfamily)
MPVAPTPLQELSRAECLERLRNARFGRIGVSVDALPAIFPVYLTMIDADLVFRTSPGTKLHAAATGAIVAVEVDRVDDTTATGWSVLVRGLAHELQDGPKFDAARELLGTTWLEGAHEHLVAVSTDLVTGRHLGQWPSGPPTSDGLR